MATVRLDPAAPDSPTIARAAELLRRGELVAFPTETVYGLGANALDPRAVERIFAVKGRPSYNPLIVHLADRADATRWVRAWPPAAEKLARAFWPGPLTLVLPKAPEIGDLVTAGLANVAVRVPRHPVALALLRAAGVPVAAPSANRSGEVSPTAAEHVAKSLGELVPLILDAGPTEVGIESTVVDLSAERAVVLRPGSIPQSSIEQVLGAAVSRPIAGDEHAPRPSPGMLQRHYAPRGELRLFDRREQEQAERLAVDAARAGRRVGGLLRGDFRARLERSFRMPDDPTLYARQLYATLHTLDEAGCDLILVERVPDATEWDGVRDRLERATRR